MHFTVEYFWKDFPDLAFGSVCVLDSKWSQLTCVMWFIFQSTSSAVTKRASMIGDMFLRNVRQKLLLKQRTEEAVKKLQVVYLFWKPNFVLFFTVLCTDIYYMMMNVNMANCKRLCFMARAPRSSPWPQVMAVCFMIKTPKIRSSQWPQVMAACFMIKTPKI